MSSLAVAFTLLLGCFLFFYLRPPHSSPLGEEEADRPALQLQGEEPGSRSMAPTQRADAELMIEFAEPHDGPSSEVITVEVRDRDSRAVAARGQSDGGAPVSFRLSHGSYEISADPGMKWAPRKVDVSIETDTAVTIPPFAREFTLRLLVTEEGEERTRVRRFSIVAYALQSNWSRRAESSRRFDPMNPGGGHSIELPHGETYRVEVTSREHQPRELEFSNPERVDELEREIALQPLQTMKPPILGRLVGCEGFVDFWAVSLSVRHSSGAYFSQKGFARSRADGRFTLEHYPDEETFRLIAEPRGVHPTIMEVAPAEVEDELLVPLECRYGVRVLVRPQLDATDLVWRVMATQDGNTWRLYPSAECLTPSIDVDCIGSFLALTSSRQPISLRVKGTGYESVERTVLPTEDFQELTINMRELGASSLHVQVVGDPSRVTTVKEVQILHELYRRSDPRERGKSEVLTEGKCGFDELVPGTYAVSLLRHDSTVVDTRDVDVSGFETTVSFDLDPLGVVLELRNTHFLNARELYIRVGEESLGVTCEDRALRISVAPGAHEVRVRADGSTIHEGEWTFRQSPVVFDFSSLVSVRISKTPPVRSCNVHFWSLRTNDLRGFPTSVRLGEGTRQTVLLWPGPGGLVGVESRLGGWYWLDPDSFGDVLLNSGQIGTVTVEWVDPPVDNGGVRVLAKVARQGVLYSHFFRAIPREIPVEMDWETWFAMAVQDGMPVAIGREGRLQALSRTAVSFSLDGTESLGITLNGTTVFGVRVTDYFPFVSNLTTLFKGTVADRVPVEMPLGPFSRFQVIDQDGQVFDDLEVDRRAAKITLPLSSAK